MAKFSLTAAKSLIAAAFALHVSAGASANAIDNAKDQLERNKKTVLAFYDLATNQSKPREAIEKYTGETYIQHNPELADGKESFIAYFEKQAKDYPAKRFEFRRVLAEGNFVVVHTWSIFPEMWRNKEWAGIDIFRLDERGKIVEHWDVLQTIPSSAANKNGMF